MSFNSDLAVRMRTPNMKGLIFASKTPKCPPKIAYTLADIAQQTNFSNDTIYDPFCGNGTILTVTGLNFAGRFNHYYGSDIDAEAVESAQLNLATCLSISDEKIIANVTPLDCTCKFPANLDGKRTTIITDPPFGRRCALPPGTLERAFENFSRNEVSTISFAFDDKTPLPEGLAEHYFIHPAYTNWDRIFYSARRKK